MSEQRHLTWVAGLTTILTSLALSPLFQSQPWLPPAILVVAVVAAVGLGGRALALPAVPVALLQVLVVALLMTYQFGESASRWWGLPTWDTLKTMNTLGISGRETINRFAPPVPPEPGVILLTVIGIAVVAIVVDLLAVGLRLVPLAGLPLLALYTVPVAVVRDGVPWLFFALAAASFVGLLVAEGRERLSRWGRSMGFSEREVATHMFVGEVETGPIGRLGRRIGATAVCLAVAVPAVLPFLENGLIGGRFAGPGPGGASIVTSDPFVDLQRDLNRPQNVPIFTYETSDPTPGYFRMVTLDTFDNVQWRRADETNDVEYVIEEDLPAQPGIENVPRTTQTTTVTVGENFQSPWLPLPFAVTKLQIDDSWGYDAESLNVFGLDHGTAGISYTAESLDLDYAQATPTGRPAPDEFDFYLRLPDDLPFEVVNQAEVVVAEAGAVTPLEKATALQEWFRTFDYSLATREGHGVDAIRAFLQERVGYCEQFAATMAIMARHLQIPSRVNIGYMPGRKVPGSQSTWQVSSHDAHAWPELYIDGFGWTRFEPTPGSAANVPDYTVRRPSESPTAPTTGPSSGSTASPGAVPRDEERGIDLGASGGFRFPTGQVLIGLGVLLFLASPRIARSLMTRRRWSSARHPADMVRTAWTLLKDSAADLGYEWDRTDTPRSLACDLAESAELELAPREALGRIARATERVMFAREGGPIGNVRKDLDVVTTALAASVGRGRRLRARWLPPSTARLTRAVSEAVADLLDWIEAAPRWLRRRPTPAAPTSR